MSNRKRKKEDLSQSTISKFFKSNNVKKKQNDQYHSTTLKRDIQSTEETSSSNECILGTIISLSDDDDDNVEGKHTPLSKSTESIISKEKDVENLEKNVCMSIRKSINKLRNYDISAPPLQPASNKEKISTKSKHNELKSKLEFSKYACTDDGSSSKKTSKINKVPMYTPLEQQYISIKQQHPDVLLFVECGYKYRFFGNDAEIASKELNIYSHLDHNFMTASIPVHRLKVHMSRLIEKGYKIGVVNQCETAALKAAGDNKNTPFTRELKHVYTKATFIDRESNDDMENTGNYLAALNTHRENGELLTAVVLINPSTGQIYYETYHKENLLIGLETIFHLFKPCEILLLKDSVGHLTERFVEHYRKSSIDIIRLEYFKLANIEAISYDILNESLLKLHDKLKMRCLQVCLNMVAFYLKDFDLQNILFCAENYRAFSTKSCMMLNGSTIKNLELFENSCDHSVKGSLFWILDNTATIFGKRLLKRWLYEPLLNVSLINERLTAVSELRKNLDYEAISNLKKELHWTIDLEKNITAVYYKKITPSKFFKFLKNLEKLQKLFSKYLDSIKNNFTSKLVLDIFANIPSILGSKLTTTLRMLDEKQALNDSKLHLFTDTSEFPALQECQTNIENIEKKLDEHLKKQIRPALKNWSIFFKTVSNLEYLVEIKNNKVQEVPKDWLKVSATKQVTRYRTPTGDMMFKTLCQAREQLELTAHQVWLQFLDKFLLFSKDCRQAIQLIATFDCLVSLAIVSNRNSYCKPNFKTDQSCIEIQNGRHAVIEMLDENKQYVANDTNLSSEQKVMLISGPNMGGKSSYIRQTALICILAQIGSYVPASSASLPVLDGVFTRMGGSDDITRGKSTFLIELEEASSIIREATDKSLVILDELGRGTSTHDGTAIAYATLKYFTEDIKPYLLFVTHYPLLSEFENLTCGYVKNYHMSYLVVDEEFERESEGVVESIVFLYKLTREAAKKSYGLNVARLAGINHEILHKAHELSNKMENTVNDRVRCRQLLRKAFDNTNLTNLRELLLEI